MVAAATPEREVPSVSSLVVRDSVLAFLLFDRRRFITGATALAYAA